LKYSFRFFLIKVTKGAEILETLHGLPHAKQYLFSLYDCQYSEFFRSLAYVEDLMKHDRYFEPHYTYYVREMRIIAYNQLLVSYSSLTIPYMADAFGVTPAFIDKFDNFIIIENQFFFKFIINNRFSREISRFIAAGRLHCKVDKVNGIVETNRPDNKNWQYQVYFLLLNDPTRALKGSN
jgi:26S proteasome regulatory subunit N7